jgi:RNA polymerase sigma-70 factor (ECF subfamily)
VDDVVSDTFVVCLRRLDQVPAEPLPWLYAVARKTFASERRKRARVAHGPALSAGEPSPAGDGELAAAFNALGERDREVLRLVAWEGLSLGEAATVLGCSAVACRVRYHRFHQTIRMRPRRAAIAVACAAAIAIPASAFAGKLGGLLGISNSGTPRKEGGESG